MLPSKENIASFLAFAPDADEGKAFMFLEGAATIDEAVGQYYDNPNKYSHSTIPSKSDKGNHTNTTKKQFDPLPGYAEPTNIIDRPQYRPHTNAVIEAGNIRAQDEQRMQSMLQNIQWDYNIFNSDIEPEHEVEWYCDCPIHEYQNAKINRLGVQERWSKAVMYPGEKAYHDCYQQLGGGLFGNNNPYRFRIVSPYGNYSANYGGAKRPDARCYTLSVQQTIALNATLNAKAQSAINAQEPKHNIWEIDELTTSVSNLNIGASSSPSPSLSQIDDKKLPLEMASPETQNSMGHSHTHGAGSSMFAGLKKAFAIKSPEERAAARAGKLSARGRELRDAILQEENGRWPDQEWRNIVAAYQAKVGMTREIARLRTHQPIQYLHLLRAGYFEPIPVAWADLASNPLKFSIEAASGWRGITPSWRGYEDTAEERLYWVLNHREGAVGVRMKPDIISEMNMARARMATAVEPPPAYFSADDTCHVQHTSAGYSKQVMPAPFRSYDAPESPTDDTMILLDVSGSMDFEPQRPNYNQYLITGYSRSTQPKNRDVAKAIIHRFTDAMINHDHNSRGYQLTTFSNYAKYIGVINHRNFDQMWRNVRFGGGTRVMTGWQKVKELHFQKHAESVTYHPVYGWQAGPQTPMLRLLLLLDGEATDMDEFELDLLASPWAHVTIFLIGVDGCPHHHRHANELQRISDINHHVSFVDAQGNTPERFVTHELLKRHLGYDVSMAEFEELEQLPPYTV